MSKNRVRRWKPDQLLRSIVLASTLGFAGCAADTASSPDPEPTTDAGSTGRFDGGAQAPADSGFTLRQDSGLNVSFDGAFASDSASLGRDAAAPRGTEGLFDPAECFDGIDNDGVGPIDCGSSFCSAVDVCCIGSTAAGCCYKLRTAFELDFSTCAELETCAPSQQGNRVFGAPSPRVTQGHFVPGGSNTSESGVVFAEEINLEGSRTTLEAIIEAPETCDDCLNAVGIALVPAGYRGDEISAAAVLGLLVSGSLGEASIHAGGSLLWRGSVDAGQHEYSLEIAASGRVRLSVDGSTADGIDIAIPMTTQPLRLAIHGRGHNTTSANPTARVSRASMSWTGCDIPSALSRQSESPVRGVDSTRNLSGASIASSPANNRLAFVSAAGIHIAHQVADTQSFELMAPEPVVPSDLNRVVSDPALVDLPFGGSRLYFTARNYENGTLTRTTIEWVDSDSGDQFSGVSQPLLDPEALGRADLASVDSPSALLVEADYFIAARAVATNGVSTLVLIRHSASGLEPAELRDVCGTGCYPSTFDVPRAVAVHQPRSGDALAFDTDELGAPALFEHEGIYRLYFAGRRSLRWSIGLLVSRDLNLFRLSNDGKPVLSGTGQSGADSLGVYDPEVWLAGAESVHPELVLFYTASDGVRTALRTANQPAP